MLDISKEDLSKLNPVTFPARKDKPLIGTKYYSLTLTGRVEYKGSKLYSFSCDCGRMCKLLDGLSFAKNGKVQGCNLCKVDRMAELRFQLFLKRFNEPYKTSHGNTLTGLYWLGDKYKRKKVVFHCDVCSEDKELWPEGSIVATYTKLSNGRTPCGCSVSACWTKSQHWIRCNRLAKEVGYEFLGFIGDWKCNETRIKLHNPETNTTWVTGTISNFYRGRRDPSLSGGFKPNLKGYIYLSSWGNFIKNGICNVSPLDRLKEQERASGLEGTLCYEWSHENGSVIQELETLIKNEFNRGVVSKEIFPDGYTETYNYNDLINIVSFVDNYLGKLDKNML